MVLEYPGPLDGRDQLQLLLRLEVSLLPLSFSTLHRARLREGSGGSGSKPPLHSITLLSSLLPLFSPLGPLPAGCYSCNYEGARGLLRYPPLPAFLTDGTPRQAKKGRSWAVERSWTIESGG